MTSSEQWLALSVALLCFYAGAECKRNFKCPSGCTCTKETIICVGTAQIPRTIPNEINSLSMVNGSIAEITEGMFSLMPSLQLLSLANNKMRFLPRDLFFDLDSLLELDLRGNSFQCICENKWLMTWLKNTNATVSDVFCAGPNDMKGKRLNDLPIPPGECISTDFVRHQSIPVQAMSADIFSFKEDIYIALAAPNTNSCVIMEWDHIEMNFRKFDNITGRDIHSLQVDGPTGTQ
uniref:Leucine-rich repeat LGI family member 2-like n=1 Tax=Salarias fasciatus TaxID=181472 RepID=A0A672GLC0_SALFA